MDSFCNAVCSTLGVPVGSELAPGVVNVFISDLGKWVSREFRKFGDGTELFKIAKTNSKQKNPTEEPHESKWLGN